MQLRRSNVQSEDIFRTVFFRPFSGVLQTELPCPCGRNALSCVDSRLGASCVAVPGQPAASSQLIAQHMLMLYDVVAEADASRCFTIRSALVSQATEDCPTSCDSTSRLCLSASFTPEGIGCGNQGQKASPQHKACFTARDRSCSRRLPGAPDPVQRSFPARGQAKCGQNQRVLCGAVLSPLF